jgi:hypothetical protein
MRANICRSDSAQNKAHCKEKESCLITNFIFHFIFALFILWIMVAFFFLRNKIEDIKQNFLPLFAIEHIELPKHKSLFVRSIHLLQEELSETFSKKTTIFVPKTEHFFCVSSFFKPLFLILNPQIEDHKKYFLFNEKPLCLKDLLKNIQLEKTTFEIRFLYEKREQTIFWSVEIKNA